ncbi:hypothetical protein ACFOUP_11975 [Belliella kenyensis]|uniref:Outer membrane protein beta-barrel domain-containing protein n=1 Tax=Belliella kenyensis TaxID=1472724 RepID=A0ABV8ELC9_9BACT|nr:hypothetical protein [Belliella kenyensis]MDN3602031.1 hypothetical protein [Belliella kenyensis]
MIAQEEPFPKGTVVLKDGSTLKGHIQYNPKASSNSIKLFIENKEMILSTGDLSSFHFDYNEKFIIKDLGSKEVDSNSQFTRLIFDGELKLYKLLDKFYLEDKKGEIFPLHKEELSNSKQHHKDNKHHLYILSYALQGECRGKIESNLQNIPLNEKALVKILSTYLTCENSDFNIFVDNRNNIKLNYIAKAGFGISRFKNSWGDNPIELDKKSNLSPIFLAGLRLDELRKLKRVSIDFLIGANTQSNVLDFHYTTDIYAIYNGTTEYTTKSLLGQMYLNYSFIRTEKIEFYTGGGLLSRINRLNVQSSSYESINKRNGSKQFYENEVYNLNSFTMGLGLKFGAILYKSKTGKIFTELDLEYMPRNSYISLSRFVELDQYNTNFFIGYSFLKRK